jgi:hypothetical protein
MGSRRVRRRAHSPVGESPTGAKRLKPRSLGGPPSLPQEWRESKTAKPSDHDLAQEVAQGTRLQRAVNAEVAS